MLTFKYEKNQFLLSDFVASFIDQSIGKKYEVAMVLPLSDFPAAKLDELTSTHHVSVRDINTRRCVLESKLHIQCDCVYDGHST